MPCDLERHFHRFRSKGASLTILGGTVVSAKRVLGLATAAGLESGWSERTSSTPA